MVWFTWGNKTRNRAILAVLAMLLLVPSTAQALDCSEQRFEGASYLVCTLDPGASDLRFFWRDTEAVPYRSFSNVASSVGTDGGKLVFAINGGMYEADFSPLGLYVENGQILRRLNAVSLDRPPAQTPNFYKKPNGVFFIDENGAAILETTAYAQHPPEARFATQSGPMLVIDNSLHPALIPGSNDRTRRSGVGVCAQGSVSFAISNGSVNFYDFARLFRDHLLCPNALFLDGGRGAGVYLPTLNRNDFSWHGGFGPIIGLVE